MSLPGRSPAAPSANARLLVISNGHGEDAIGARLASRLASELPWLTVQAFPLVGLGTAYEAAGVATVGPRRALPSGGLTLHHQRLLVADLRAGLLPLTLAQLGFLRRSRPAAVLVVGDAFAQFMAQMVPAPRRVLQPLVSAHQSFDLGGRPLATTALHRTFMERIRAPERWLMLRADKVYTRDAETATELRRRGVGHAVSLGNPVMDDLEAAPLVGAQRGEFDELVIALLPGSRGYAERSLTLMADALRALAAKQAHAVASHKPAETDDQQGADRGEGRHRLLALVAWTRPGVPTPPTGWHEAAGSAASSLAGVERVWRLAPDEFGKRVAPTELWFVRGRFAAVLASASVVVGTAGTANEQAAGLGLPVITFEVPPDYGSAFLANQERLLGGAARVVESEPEAVARAVLAAGAGSAHLVSAARSGPLRMGPAGGTAALVADLAAWLGQLRGPA